MMKKNRVICYLAVCVSLCLLISCFDAAENNYRITSSTFATVTRNETGSYRLYLDGGRGVVDPSAESAEINWGDAERVFLYYDIPFVDTLYDYSRFRAIVRDAWKIETVNLVDVTEMEKVPSSLGRDTIYSFDFQAYWGYITMQAVPGNMNAFDMTCSYDRNAFKGDTLFLNLHYAKRQGTWNMGMPQTVCAQIPEFVRKAVTSDSLCIAMSALQWYSNAADSAVNYTRYFKISRDRLSPPTYDYSSGGYY